MLTAPVDEKGNIYADATKDNMSEPTLGKGTLGKDAFLKLLVAQMSYQDPLNPSSDTEWISQMATFSSLEEMQNMNTTLGNTQALNLVGASVIMKTTLSTGETTLVGGTVDYVIMQSGKAYLAINDGLYSIDDLDTVADEEYLKKLIADGTVTDAGKGDSDKTDGTEGSDNSGGSDKTDGDSDNSKNPDKTDKA